MIPAGKRPAPELRVERWFNTDGAISLESLRGRVVAIYVFQLLCEGCVHMSLPQAREVFETFPRRDVAVLGLHSPVEESPRTGLDALAEFLRFHRLNFPVAADAAGDGWQRATFAAYGFQGTPTLVLLDRKGQRRLQHLGHVPDLRLGATLQQLSAEQA